MDKEHRDKLATACWSGVSAIAYVTDPERWAAFAAFAEQMTPGTPWTKADRFAMRQDGRVLVALANALEKNSDEVQKLE